MYEQSDVNEDIRRASRSRFLSLDPFGSDMQAARCEKRSEWLALITKPGVVFVRLTSACVLSFDSPYAEVLNTSVFTVTRRSPATHFLIQA